MIGYIDSANIASIRLHENFGFRRVGLLPFIGYKFGKWTDSLLMQRSLGPGETTAPDVAFAPSDGSSDTGAAS